MNLVFWNHSKELNLKEHTGGSQATPSPPTNITFVGCHRVWHSSFLCFFWFPKLGKVELQWRAISASHSFCFLLFPGLQLMPFFEVGEVELHLSSLWVFFFFLKSSWCHFFWSRWSWAPFAITSYPFSSPSKAYFNINHGGTISNPQDTCISSTWHWTTTASTSTFKSLLLLPVPFSLSLRHIKISGVNSQVMSWDHLWLTWVENFNLTVSTSMIRLNSSALMSEHWTFHLQIHKMCSFSCN